MGICGSTAVSAEALRAKKLDDLIEKDKRDEEQKVKLLLLGAGESGKSTIFKQMRILYGVGFSEEDRKNFRAVIHSNTVLSMRTLVTQATERGLNIAAERALAVFNDVPDDGALTEDVGRAIAQLWADAAIQEVYSQKSRFHLNDSAKYYFDKVQDLASPSYVPSESDVLHSRVRTSGIVEEGYNIEGVKFMIYDVGGQKNERKKWIHCFEEVTAVIFVASMSDYDQMMLEDNCVNRMVDAQLLFTDIVRSKWFEKSSIILFLNKVDLFKGKIQSIDLRYEGSDGIPSRFLNYTHGCAEGPAMTFIVNFFLMGVPSGRNVTTHCTCATDSKNVSTIFNACKEQILKDNTRGSGFMD